MKIQEPATVDSSRVTELRKLVARGEGAHLEFKRKASFPEKIIKEIIAFANTEGGTLLIGVDDNGSLAGVKYPEEEIHAIEQALAKYCRPAVSFETEIINLSSKKFIVALKVPLSDRRPHRLVQKDVSHKGTKERRETTVEETYVRYKDMSVKASREVREIIRRSRQGKDVKFTYGPPESALIKFLEANGSITLSQFCRLAKLNKFIASRKLVTLVLARVLRVTPAQPDLYSRV
jgi:predicted HTH transcriptional regulator